MTVRVRATSTDGSTAIQEFNLAVTDKNEFGAVYDTPADANTATNTVQEGAAANTLVGITASADDADLSDTISKYEIVDASGNVVTNGPFQISSSGVVSVLNGAQIDYETAQSTTVRVKATSTDGSSAIQNYNVAVQDVGEESSLLGADSGPTCPKQCQSHLRKRNPALYMIMPV